MSSTFNESDQPIRQSQPSGLVTILYGLLPLVIVGVVLFVLVIIGGKALQAYEMRQEARALERRIDDLKRENRRLSQELEYYRSDEYIEKVAREELGLVRPADVALIVPMQDPPRPSLLLPTPTATPPPSSTRRDVPTWQRWLALFVDRD